MKSIHFSPCLWSVYLLYLALLLELPPPRVALSLSSAGSAGTASNNSPILDRFSNENGSSSSSSSSSLAMSNLSDDEKKSSTNKESSLSDVGRLEELKLREAELSRLLASIRREKLDALRSRPLAIGIVGFGRFGQFIARSFTKYGRVIVTSRSDYTELAMGMGVRYVPLTEPERFFAEGLDVVVIAVSILSFEDTLRNLVSPLRTFLGKNRETRDLPGPLFVDVLSVKDYPRQVMLDLLPSQCDILCTHPMFGPDSGKNGWHGLNFVYERTRIDGVLLDPQRDRQSFHQLSEAENDENPDQDQLHSFVDLEGKIHDIHEDSEAHIQGMDRMERFLSIWEEEGCRMVPMPCKDHDEYAANSQFITHLMGRILGTQGLVPTPIDTRGFESVLKLVGSTTADSFDLFYGLYKYNRNSVEAIQKLRSAMDDVVQHLKEMEEQDKNSNKWMQKVENNSTSRSKPDRDVSQQERVVLQSKQEDISPETIAA